MEYKDIHCGNEEEAVGRERWGRGTGLRYSVSIMRGLVQYSVVGIRERQRER